MINDTKKTQEIYYKYQLVNCCVALISHPQVLQNKVVLLK